VTFRARLTLFFLGIVAAPLIGGAVLAGNLSRAQAVRDADARLQVAALSATNALQQERLVIPRDLSSAVALRAVRAPTSAGLDSIRRSARLDYLAVVRDGRVVASSIEVSPGLPTDAAAIEAGVLRPVAAERRVAIRGRNVTVLGGRVWRPGLASTLDVRAVLVLDGHPVGGVPGSFSPSLRPVTADGDRVVCMCRNGGEASGLVLFTPAHAEGLGRWFRWPAVALLAVGLVVLVSIAYGLAWLLARPLSRLAQEAEAVARGEPDAAPAVDPAAGREFGQVERTLRSVSAELTGSRGELAQARGRLVASERLTLVDPLTGAWNRRYLDQALREQVKRFQRYGSPFAILMIDCDHFKRVNDQHGHAAGDAVLVGVARTIGRSIRSDIDVLARFGGEEFVAVLPETDAEGAVAAAEKIRKLVAGTPLEHEGATIAITVSIGVTACPTDGREPERLLATADSALYRAKHAGRNRTVSASPPASTPREA